MPARGLCAGSSGNLSAGFVCDTGIVSKSCAPAPRVSGVESLQSRAGYVPGASVASAVACVGSETRCLCLSARGVGVVR
eukprot:712477-Rhodomonas_salina.2